MKLIIRTSILLICVLTLLLGSCTKLRTKDDENSVTSDSGNTNVTTWDTADSAKRVDISKIEEDSVQGYNGYEGLSTPNKTDSTRILRTSPITATLHPW